MIVIKDEVMDPCEIVVDSMSFMVRVGYTNENGDKVYMMRTYHADLKSALRKVEQIKNTSDDMDTVSLEEYIERQENMFRRLQEVVPTKFSDIKDIVR